ncbi:uncharacterized protein LOC135935008 [Cloeon dipterum]|uniref:uncharacterized protein LOC135935008 n=1 Tax=Cloeon dipterum TaxID=197152 RepID=UPI00321F9C1D
MSIANSIGVMSVNPIEITRQRLAGLRDQDAPQQQQAFNSSGRVDSVGPEDPAPIDIFITIGDGAEAVSTSVLSSQKPKSIRLSVVGPVSVEEVDALTAKINEPNILDGLTSLEVVMDYRQELHDVFRALSRFMKYVSSSGPRLVQLSLFLESRFSEFMRVARISGIDLSTVRMISRSAVLVKALDPSLYELLGLYDCNKSNYSPQDNPQEDDETDEEEFEIVDGYVHPYIDFEPDLEPHDDDFDPSYYLTD